MISYLSGFLKEKKPNFIVLDVHGVGYELLITSTTFSDLPSLESPVLLHTHVQTKEDGQTLYGFTTQEERQAFRTLLAVTGVGGRIAANILSFLTPDELATCVELEQVSRFVAVPGVGKKTAERIILDLKGKLRSSASKNEASSTVKSTDLHRDIMEGLMGLGYKEAESRRAVEALPADIDTSAGLRMCLKLLAKG